MKTARALCLVIALGGLATQAPAAETYGPYKAEVLRVIDGDTVELRVHLWPGLTRKIKLRLEGIDTPEKRGSPDCEKALAWKATRFTRRFLGAGGFVRVTDVRLGKYAGRALGRIVVPGKGDLGRALLAAGLAREYRGGRRGPWCGE